jgi:hypothetical protein
MIISEDIKKVIENSAFITLVTQCEDGTSHPIIAGKGEVAGDTVLFDIYKMEVTQKNLASYPKAIIVAGSTAEPIGYRLTGTAMPNGKKLVFCPEKSEKLI